MLRVKDLEKSIQFYTDLLGMNLIRRSDYPGGKFTLAFVGYGPEKTDTVLELTFNWETTEYDIGNAYGHIAIETNDIYAICEKIKRKGGTINREPGPMKHGSTIIAFATDPDGYKIEFIQKKSSVS